MFSIKRGYYRTILSLIVLCLAVSTISCSRIDPPKVLRIGVIGPESGITSQLGQAQRKAIQMAAEEVNATSHLPNEWRLEIFFEDDEGNPTKSASVAHKLIRDHSVNIIIGAVQSSATLAVKTVTGRAGILLITAGSTSPAITEANTRGLVFRTALNDKFQATSLVAYAEEILGPVKVATLTAEDEYGNSGRQLLSLALKRSAMIPVAELTYKNGEQDFTTHLLKIKNAQAQAIFIWGTYYEAALIAKQVKVSGLNFRLLGASGMAANRMLDADNHTEGLILTQTFIPDAEYRPVTSFTNRYRQRYQEYPNPHAAQAYDTVYIIADAIKRADNTSPSSLSKAIMNTSRIKLVTGEPQFNAQGDDIGKYLLITTISNGKFKLIKSVSAHE